jgi:type II secretory pathway pseudopilin PulG
MRRPFIRRNPNSNAQRGYILLTLMLFVSLLVIGALAVLPEMAFEAKRDREEEMIHRGVQYSRAIQHYYKKFGTYPANLDALENTQNLRFLRKRYKDPITGKDFKILRMTDVQMGFGAGIAGAQAVGGGLNSPFGANTLGATAAGPSPGSNSPFGKGPTSGAAVAGNSFNANVNGATPGAVNTNQAGDQGDAATAATDPNAGPGASPAKPGTPNAAQGQSDSSESKDEPKSPFVTASGQSAGATIGGTPIVGVASISKAQSIRVFNKKSKYNEWQFVYDPSSDRGGLLNAPVQPGMQQGAVVAPGQAGQTNNPTGFGSNSPFSNNPGSSNPTSGPATTPSSATPSPQN